MPKVVGLCLECGREFLSWPSQHRRLCSLSCARRYQMRDEQQYLMRAGQLRKRAGERETVACARCGTGFERPLSRRSGNGKYCSMACYDVVRSERRLAFRCTVCGRTDSMVPSLASQRYCSRECQSIGRTSTGTGRTHNGRPVRVKKGYLYVYDPDHFVPSRDGWHAEHRYLLERALGCALPEGAHVHHVNGNSTDNRIENLRPMSGTEHFVLTRREQREQIERDRAELAEYRRRFGPLPEEV